MSSFIYSLIVCSFSIVILLLILIYNLHTLKSYTTKSDETEI